MILSYTDLFSGEQHRIEATITTDHAASSYGIPVIVLPDGENLPPASWVLLGYQVVEATPEERAALQVALMALG